MSRFKVRQTEIKIIHQNKDVEGDEYIDIEYTQIFTSTGNLEKFMNENGSVNVKLVKNLFLQKINDANSCNDWDITI